MSTLHLFLIFKKFALNTEHKQESPVMYWLLVSTDVEQQECS